MGPFDLVTASHMLYDVPDPDRALAEAPAGPCPFAAGPAKCVFVADAA